MRKSVGMCRALSPWLLLTLGGVPVKAHAPICGCVVLQQWGTKPVRPASASTGCDMTPMMAAETCADASMCIDVYVCHARIMCIGIDTAAPESTQQRVGVPELERAIELAERRHWPKGGSIEIGANVCACFINTHAQRERERKRERERDALTHR